MNKYEMKIISPNTIQYYAARKKKEEIPKKFSNFITNNEQNTASRLDFVCIIDNFSIFHLRKKTQTNVAIFYH